MEDNNQSGQDNGKTIEYGPAAVVAGDASSPKNGGKFGFLKKKPVVIALIVVLLLAAGGAAYFLTKDDGAAPEETSESTRTSMGVVPSLVDGTATYKSGGDDWQPLTTETALAEGDFVSTEAGARVILAFDDGSVLRLDESSIIQLSSLEMENIQVEQTAGTVYSRVVESDRSYTVNVAETSYTALGTAFTTISKSDSKGVQVIQSSVKINEDDVVPEGKQFFKENQDANLKDKQTDINLDDLKSDAFMLWNLEQDEKDSKFKSKLGILEKIKPVEEEPEPEQESPGGIKLSAVNNDKATVLSWSVGSVSAGDGFKVVRSKSSATPTYGKDESALVDKATRSYAWKSKTEGTFWYRVCAYRPSQNTCTDYSNAVQMKAVYVAPEKVTRGTIVLTEDSGLLTWNYTGKAIYGYKVAMATHDNPTYPDDGYVYAGSATSYAIKLDGKPAGTYYFRVCAYTDGTETEKCVDGSNVVPIVKS